MAGKSDMGESDMGNPDAWEARDQAHACAYGT
jgi:hypothetical protein